MKHDPNAAACAPVPRRSHWLHEALASDTDVSPSLRGAERADVAILGGGYCGLWTALEIKSREPALDVVVVERDICGGGASGRNAGYVMDLWAKFLTLRELCGAEEAIRICYAAAQCIVEIGDFCRQHAIDAGFRRSGWLWSASCERQHRPWRQTEEALERVHCAPFIELSRSDLRDKYGLRGALAGVLQPTVALIQPAKLARGMRRVALDCGVRVFENSKVTQVCRGPECRVRTQDGTLTAASVVVALNAWATIFPEIRRGLAVTAAEACVTARVPEILAKLGWSQGPGITDSRRMILNWRATPDGRVEMGKGGGRLAFGSRVAGRFDGGAIRVRQIVEEVALAVPDLKGIDIATSWMGPIDKSFHGLPAASRFPNDENMFYGCGFSGNGVGPSKLIAKILASLVLRRADEYSSLGLAQPLQGTFPREPVRYLGGRCVLAAMNRHDQLDHANQSAGVLTRWLVSKMPGSILPGTVGDDGNTALQEHIPE
jgi:glycine/D-amino acid oxidase-like deaminating enzyme